MPLKHKKYLAFVPILVFAFALRMWEINARSMWFDESFEYWASTVGLQDLLTTVTTSFQPPLYNFLLHFWLNFGSDAIWLRFLSVAFSMLGLLGLMVLGHRLFGIRGAIVVGLLMATLPTEIKYAQEVAEYALMSFMLSWALLSLFRALRVSTWKAWGVWGIFCVMAVYSHYGAAISVFALSAIVFIENIFRHELAKLGKQASVIILSLVLGLPLLYFLPKQLLAQKRNPVVLGDFIYEIKSLVENTGKTFLFPLTGEPFSSLPKWLPLLGIGSILLLSLLMLLFCQDKDLKRVFLWFWGEYLVYYWSVRASLYAYGNYGFRYMLILLPLFVLVMAAVVSKLHESKFLFIKATATGLLFLTIALGVYSLPNRSISEKTRNYTAWPETQDVREVVLYWRQHSSYDTPTYIYYGAAPAFRYYARLYGIEQEILLPPAWYSSCWQGLPVEHCVVDNVYYGVWFRSSSLEDKVSSIQNTFGTMPKRFWIIFSHIYADENNDIVKQLLDNYKIEDEFRQVNAVAYLLMER